MLWALLRLSVRDARSQLRYGRLGDPGLSLACRRPRRRGPGIPAPAVPPRSFRSGPTRSDGAGTGSRARPESESDLPHVSRSHERYTQRLYPETRAPPTPHDTAGSPAPAGGRRTARGRPRAVRLTRLPCGSEVHVTAAAGRGGGRVLLRLLRDHGLGGEEQARDRSRVLQRRPGDLRGVDDAGLEHVDIITGRGVQALPGGQGLDLLDHHAALEAGVHRDLLERLFQRTAHDLRAGRLVTRQVELLEGDAARLDQCDAAAGHDTFLDRGLGVAHRVLDAVLALLQLDLGGRPRLDDGDRSEE